MNVKIPNTLTVLKTPLCAEVPVREHLMSLSSSS